MVPIPDPEPGRCDSCGDGVDDLVPVVRLYVVPESWDTERRVTEAEGVERWCFPCRTHYPHRPAGADEG